ncbi:hypothetical protein [Pannonibacter sp. SL95]|uniref:hypothetical protein n=1 Tax=Pannonibacter sp. SL95 TaxID=2995153 RepID=UPI0022761786|nr:hypothetical protein [Pannonibacter sp. SL95]MCY1707170.1 hypothetical protein [Pannonibacter sp. SL95]
MQHRTIAAHIPELSAPGFPRLSKADVVIADVILGNDRPPEPTVEERLAAEYARGVRTGRQAARLEVDAELEKRVEGLREEFETARRAYEQEAAEMLGETLADSFEQLETRLAEATERVLLPFLGEAVTGRALESFRTALTEILTGWRHGPANHRRQRSRSALSPDHGWAGAFAGPGPACVR